MKKLSLFLTILLVFTLTLPVFALEASDQYTEEDIIIQADGYGIAATLTLPVGEGLFPAVVMLHGNGSNRHEAGNAYDYAAPEMAKAGIATLRFDYIGNGDSKEDYIDFTYDKAIDDALSCYNYLETLGTINMEKVGLLGWSMGGRIALLAASDHEEFISLCTWAGAATEKEEQEEYDIAKKDGFYEVTYDWREPLKQGPEYYEVAMAKDYAKAIAAIKAPILAINGSEDTAVLPEVAQFIIDHATNQNSKVLILEGADHTFNVFTGDLTILEKLTQETINWFLATLQ